MIFPVDVIIGLAMVLFGLVVGLGMALVRPAEGEPEMLAKWVNPLAELYRFTSVRLFVSLVGFLIAGFGAYRAYSVL